MENQENTNPFIKEKVGYDLSKIICHLKERWPSVCDTQSRILYRFNGKYFEPLMNGQLNRLLRNIIGEEIGNRSLENIASAFKDSVSVTSIHELTNKRYLNFENGVFDIKRKELLPHEPEYFFLNQMPIKYVSNARCPKWMKFLNDVFQGDQEVIRLMSQVFGYTLLPHCNLQKYVILFGDGANGKSTLANMLLELLGSHNVSNLSMSELGERFNLIALKNKYANICEETPSSKQIHMDIIKRLSDGGIFSSDIKYGERESFSLHAKLIFCSNVIPNFEHTHGAQRRLILIPFNRIFEEHEMDRELPMKLKSEMSGILNWALDGLSEIEKNGKFTIPDKILKASSDFHNSYNSVSGFLEQYCEMEESSIVDSALFYHAFCKYCEEEQLKPISNALFGRKVKTLTNGKVLNERDGVLTEGIRRRSYYGIKLREGWQKLNNFTAH